MGALNTEALEQFVTQLETQIALANRMALPEAAQLLAMARLDVQMKMHQISKAELKALCETLDRSLYGPRSEMHCQRKIRSRRRHRSRGYTKPVRAAIRPG